MSPQDKFRMTIKALALLFMALGSWSIGSWRVSAGVFLLITGSALLDLAKD